MTEPDILECVVNISEGVDAQLLAELAEAAGPSLLDIHRDADHNRSVWSMAGPPSVVEDGVRSLARRAVAGIDLRTQRGVHPRIGALDVVPFITLNRASDSHNLSEGDIGASQQAQERFAQWAAAALDLPCFFYGTQRTLPELRRRAWKDLQPDTGPAQPHPTAGACAVGARGLLVAYNLWLDGADLAGRDVEIARRVAGEVRGPGLRTLGLAVDGGAQVSCNLIAPGEVGPQFVFDEVARRVAVRHAELVGLLPRAVLEATPRHRWTELGIDAATTIEARLEETGLDGGRFTVTPETRP